MQALPSWPADFMTGLKNSLVSLESLPFNLYGFASYVGGMGIINYFGDWFQSSLPYGASAGMNDFYTYSARGATDMSKYMYMEYLMSASPSPPPSPSGGYSTGMSPMSRPSGVWGAGNSGLMGYGGAVGVNRVGGQY
jgi:hypothetical protein